MHDKRVLREPIGSPLVSDRETQGKDNAMVQNGLSSSYSASDVLRAAEKSDASRVELTSAAPPVCPNCDHVEQ